MLSPFDLLDDIDRFIQKVLNRAVHGLMAARDIPKWKITRFASIVFCLLWVAVPALDDWIIHEIVGFVALICLRTWWREEYAAHNAKTLPGAHHRWWHYVRTMRLVLIVWTAINSYAIVHIVPEPYTHTILVANDLRDAWFLALLYVLLSPLSPPPAEKRAPALDPALA